ncbi:MAG: glycerol-3-phosphate 1-O-acyltransferase PlsY [Alphaproteobacteria bacterium]|nr:glycerol-3-phosphate 1-O-acyltransferase PlsY [Alphaproteobacteria bacterium]
MAWQSLLIPALGGYLLGSIPFGLLVGLATGAGDVRKIGSGNIGATNVLRTGNRWAAAATLICDAGKGLVAVLLARKIFGIEGAIAAGAGAFVGHLFPVWLKFKGGKGVATFLGVVLACSWLGGIGFAVTWLGAAAVWRISSLAALIAAALAPAYLLMLHQPAYATLAAALALAIFAMHRSNIARLLAGTEPQIGAAGADR